MIRVECARCGTRLRGPDNAAGKNIKCPKCGDLIPVPRPGEEPESLLDDFQAPPGAYDFDEPAPVRTGQGLSEDGRMPCPACGESIAATAAKCRFCGEVLDSPTQRVKVKSKKKKKKSGEDDDLSTTDMVLCLLCPGIACIASVVYLIQGKGKGLKVLGLSILGNVIWGFVRLAIQSSMNQPGVGP